MHISNISDITPASLIIWFRSVPKMEEENELPRGIVRQQRRGWQGEELEIDHQREAIQSGKVKEAAAVAVDIRQFQNHVVGEGYQARHVVRQPSSKPRGASLQVKDMTGGAKFSGDTSTPEKADSGDRRYIQNAGLREFRKEIEAILASP